MKPCPLLPPGTAECRHYKIYASLPDTVSGTLFVFLLTLFVFGILPSSLKHFRREIMVNIEASIVVEHIFSARLSEALPPLSVNCRILLLLTVALLADYWVSVLMLGVLIQSQALCPRGSLVRFSKRYLES